MRTRTPHLCRARLVLCILMVASASTLPARAAFAAEMSDGPKRVDFDDRLVRGQRRSAGTVYIFQREKVELRSMVTRPRSFRQRIITSVYRD